MKRSVFLWQLMGFAVVSLGGTLLHYLYEWTGGSPWIAPFSGINESTWEHMKLLFWPAFLYAVFERFFFREIAGYWCVKLRGILLGIFLIPIIFYTWNGAVGPSPDWFNISVFFLAAAVMYVFETRQFRGGSARCRFPKAALLLLCVIAGLFVLFTFTTPEWGIFRDPLTGTYGIQ